MQYAWFSTGRPGSMSQEECEKLLDELLELDWRPGMKFPHGGVSDLLRNLSIEVTSNEVMHSRKVSEQLLCLLLLNCMAMTAKCRV